MKRNYVPEGMTYNPAEVAERNEYIDALCVKVQPLARQAFVSAVGQQTATESAEALVEEARSALLDLLAMPEHQPRLDDESRKLMRALAGALKEKSELREPKIESAWIERRSKDLARAVVGFWVNLGEDVVSRYKASTIILDEMIAGKDTERRRKFETIYSRFWLDHEDARQLLSYVEALGFMPSIIKKVKPSFLPAGIEELFERLRPEQEPAFVQAVMTNLDIEPYVLKMREYTLECEPALGLIKVIDRINREQFQLIEKGSGALRERRIAAMQVSVALTRAAVMNSIAYCAGGGPSFSTRFARRLRSAKILVG